MQPDWSILVPTVPSRIRSYFPDILDELNSQIGDRNIEVLGLYDNKRRVVGAKRNALLQLAKGRYVSFIDDDDRIAPDYVEQIHEAVLTSNCDVIVYDHLCTVNGGVPYLCRYGVEYEYVHTPKMWTGKPSHTQTWRTDLVQLIEFPVASVGEDMQWVARASSVVQTQHRIDKILYYYDCRDDVSETRSEGLLRDVRPVDYARWRSYV